MKYLKYLKIKLLDIEVGNTPIVVLHKKDADDLGVHISDRIKIQDGKCTHTAIVDITDTFLIPGDIGLFKTLSKTICAETGTKVKVIPTRKPPSIRFIRKKMDGQILTENEIQRIVQDIVNNDLSQVELSAFITSVYVRGLNTPEIVSLTKNIVTHGQTLDLDVRPIIDKHCIGGIAGNRTTLIVVPIIAAAGLYIPKTSSRAITSPAGTIDSMEVLAPINFNIEEMRDIVMKAHGCIVWGGGVNLASADDKLIKIRYPLKIDPEPLLLASILAKKKAVGANKVLIDIPVGHGSKIKETKYAKELAANFIKIGNKIDIDVECAITPGDRPIGKGIGPQLEARDAIQILHGKGPSDLRMKSLSLAGILLEMGGIAEKGKGFRIAENILNNGKALEAMQYIIELQGGDPRHLDIEPQSLNFSVNSPHKGRIYDIDNNAVIKIARAAGAPVDKYAGLDFHVSRGALVKKGEPLFSINAEKEYKLDAAIEAVKKWKPIIYEKMILDRYSGSEILLE